MSKPLERFYAVFDRTEFEAMLPPEARQSLEKIHKQIIDADARDELGIFVAQIEVGKHEVYVRGGFFEHAYGKVIEAAGYCLSRGFPAPELILPEGFVEVTEDDREQCRDFMRAMINQFRDEREERNT
jgi:hypothetical protein